MTWIDVIKEQLAKMRKEGKSPSIGDVTPAAKKEWAEIKAGKHPRYSQGSSQGKKGKSNKKEKSKKKEKSNKKEKSIKNKSSKKGKSNKTQKIQKKHMKNSSASMNHTYCIEQMLKKVHLCKKDVAHIHKYMKTQKGGDCGCSQSGGSCDSCQAGGKKGKGKGKGMKGGAGADADADAGKEPYVSIVDKESGEYDGSEETDGTNEKVVRDED